MRRHTNTHRHTQMGRYTHTDTHKCAGTHTHTQMGRHTHTHTHTLWGKHLGGYWGLLTESVRRSLCGEQTGELIKASCWQELCSGLWPKVSFPFSSLSPSLCHTPPLCVSIHLFISLKCCFSNSRCRPKLWVLTPLCLSFYLLLSLSLSVFLAISLWTVVLAAKGSGLSFSDVDQLIVLLTPLPGSHSSPYPLPGSHSSPSPLPGSPPNIGIFSRCQLHSVPHRRLLTEVLFWTLFYLLYLSPRIKIKTCFIDDSNPIPLKRFEERQRKGSLTGFCSSRALVSVACLETFGVLENTSAVCWFTAQRELLLLHESQRHG